MKMYVDVLVEIETKHLDKTFTYHVPKELEAEVMIGKRVLVPFGARELEGYILNIKNSSEMATKDLTNILDAEPILNDELLYLGKFMQKQTLSSLCSCYNTMLPKALKASQKSQIKVKKEIYLKLTASLDELLKEPITSAGRDVLSLFTNADAVLQTKANKVSASAVKTLLNKGFLVLEEREVYRYNLDSYQEEQPKKLLVQAKLKCI